VFCSEDKINAALGCVIIVVEEMLHPLASVAVIVYVFAKSVLNIPVVSEKFPGLEEYVILPVPPLTIVLILPLAALKQ
jgi:hypothetical protein